MITCLNLGHITCKQHYATLRANNIMPHYVQTTLCHIMCKQHYATLRADNTMPHYVHTTLCHIT